MTKTARSMFVAIIMLLTLIVGGYVCYANIQEASAEDETYWLYGDYNGMHYECPKATGILTISGTQTAAVSGRTATPWANNTHVIGVIDCHNGSNLSQYALFANLPNCTSYTTGSGFVPSTNGNLHYMFENWGSAEGIAGTWNASNIDLSGWATGRINNISSIFRGCGFKGSFSFPSGMFHNDTWAQSLFYGCSYLTSVNISSLATVTVSKFDFAFYNCAALTEIIGIENMKFAYAENYALPTPESPNVGMCTFYGCKTLTSLDLHNWDISNWVNLRSMFYGCESLASLNLTGWDVGNVVTMYSMFSDCYSLVSLLGIDDWDTSKVTNMAFMFDDCRMLESLDLSNFNISHVTTVRGMLQNCNSLKTLNISGWDFSSVTDSAYFVAGSEMAIEHLIARNMVLTDEVINKTGTSATTTASFWRAFRVCSYQSIKTIDMAGCDLSAVSSASYMFHNFNAMTTLDVSGWDTSNVAGMIYLFCDCASLTALDVSGWDTGNVTTMADMFKNCQALTNLDVSGWDTGKVIMMENMFANCQALTTLDVSGWNTGNVTSIANMFRDCASLTTLDVSSWNTGNVVIMGASFYNCQALTALDVSGWDTGKVMFMSAMFYNCASLTSLDAGNWNTENVTDMANMFDSCEQISALDVSGWATDNVTNMRYMFNSCRALTTLDVSNWHTGNVTNMECMFYICTRLGALDVSRWDTSKATNMRWLFYGSRPQFIDVSNWDTSKVTNMERMFASTSVQFLDVSHWDTSKVTNMEGMFANCASLTSLDISNWDVSSISSHNNIYNMFSGCNRLLSIDMCALPEVAGDIDLPTIKFGPLNKTFYYYIDNNNDGIADSDKTETKIAASANPAGSHNRYAICYPLITENNTVLLPGESFNIAIKRLVDTNIPNASTATTKTNAIKKIAFVNVPFTSDIDVSAAGASIYAKKNEDVIELYTNAENIYMSTDSSYAFYWLNGLTEIEVPEGFSFSIVKYGDSMFTRSFLPLKDPKKITVVDFTTGDKTPFEYDFSAEIETLTDAQLFPTDGSTVLDLSKSDFMNVHCSDSSWVRDDITGVWTPRLASFDGTTSLSRGNSCPLPGSTFWYAHIQDIASHYGDELQAEYDKSVKLKLSSAMIEGITIPLSIDLMEAFPVLPSVSVPDLPPAADGQVTIYGNLSDIEYTFSGSELNIGYFFENTDEDVKAAWNTYLNQSVRDSTYTIRCLDMTAIQASSLAAFFKVDHTGGLGDWYRLMDSEQSQRWMLDRCYMDRNPDASVATDMIIAYKTYMRILAHHFDPAELSNEDLILSNFTERVTGSGRYEIENNDINVTFSRIDKMRTVTNMDEWMPKLIEMAKKTSILRRLAETDAELEKAIIQIQHMDENTLSTGVERWNTSHPDILASDRASLIDALKIYVAESAEADIQNLEALGLHYHDYSASISFPQTIELLYDRDQNMSYAKFTINADASGLASNKDFLGYNLSGPLNMPVDGTNLSVLIFPILYEDGEYGIPVGATITEYLRHLKGLYEEDYPQASYADMHALWIRDIISDDETTDEIINNDSYSTAEKIHLLTRPSSMFLASKAAPYCFNHVETVDHKHVVNLLNSHHDNFHNVEYIAVLCKDDGDIFFEPAIDEMAKVNVGIDIDYRILRETSQPTGGE